VDVTNKETGQVVALNKEVKAREGEQVSTFEDKVAVGTFPKKGVKYLVQNAVLMEIATSFGVVRSFDRARYADLILLLNTFQKTYIYILMERYDVADTISTFTDLGESILELMYSLVLVLPEKFKHIYGVDPDKLVNENIAKFKLLRRTMTRVLESYAKKEAGVNAIPISLPSASDTPFKNVNKLP